MVIFVKVKFSLFWANISGFRNDFSNLKNAYESAQKMLSMPLNSFSKKIFQHGEKREKHDLLIKIALFA